MVLHYHAAQHPAMADGTTIGSASPGFMSSGGETLNNTVTEDAVTQIRVLKRRWPQCRLGRIGGTRRCQHHRHRSALVECHRCHCPDVTTLLNDIDGETVRLASGPATLVTANARTADVDMSAFERFLQFLSNPNVGYLFSLGMLGLFFFQLSYPAGCCRASWARSC